MKVCEDCFGASGQPLIKAGRVLVGEGVLTKLCRKKPKPRQFFLFNDILVYGNILINKKKYNKQHILPLEEVKIITLEDEGNFRNGWQIISASKSFAVYASTPTEKQEWMAHINKCISDLIKKTGKKPCGDLAAVWVPDQSANVCMACTKTKFTALARRHHCRRCGSVVCGGCSSQRFLMKHISSKPVRVCDKCYEKMSSGQVKPEDPVVNEGGIREKMTTDDKSSLSRRDAERITESGSSAEESDEEDGNPAEAKPTFYEDKPAETTSLEDVCADNQTIPPVAAAAPETAAVSESVDENMEE